MYFGGLIANNIDPDQTAPMTNTVNFFINCVLYFVIGIKLVFLCINICWVMLKGEGFNDPPSGLADVSASENHV